MAKTTKRMAAAMASFDRKTDYSVADAVKIIKDNAKVKFDETVEIAINLGVDPRHAFDRVIATPDMMPLVGRVARVLGPKGMMPNPKVGTVTMDIAKAVSDAKGGAVEFRAEKAGVVHAGVGKVSFAQDKLEENVNAFIDAIRKARPTGAKGTYVKRITLTSTMGPGVKIDSAG